MRSIAHIVIIYEIQREENRDKFAKAHNAARSSEMRRSIAHGVRSVQLQILSPSFNFEHFMPSFDFTPATATPLQAMLKPIWST